MYWLSHLSIINKKANKQISQNVKQYFDRARSDPKLDACSSVVLLPHFWQTNEMCRLGGCISSLKDHRLPSLLSYHLLSPQSAHGWLSAVLCIIISHSSSSQLGCSWAIWSWIKASALFTENNFMERGCEKLKSFTSKSCKNVFTDKVSHFEMKLFTCRHVFDTKACF